MPSDTQARQSNVSPAIILSSFDDDAEVALDEGLSGEQTPKGGAPSARKGSLRMRAFLAVPSSAEVEEEAKRPPLE